MIGKNTNIGKTTTIFHPDQVNIYGCTIGEHCKIGSFVEIKPNVIIGNNVKIEPFVFIPDGVTIEDNVFIGPGVVFTNDKHPRATTEDGKLKDSADWTITPTVVKQGAAIGANATILCGITISEHATIGAGAVVTKDVLPNTTVVGNPAKIL